MKTKFAIITVLCMACAIALTLVSGCGGGGGGSTATSASVPTGSARLSFVMPGGSSGRETARTVSKIPDTTASIEIRVTNDRLSSPIVQTLTGAPGELVTATIADIPVGETTFAINAKDANGSIVAAGNEIVTIFEGRVSLVYSELGIVTDGSLTVPSTFTLAVGETLNVKNISALNSFALSIPNTNCPPTALTFGRNGQLSCTFTSPGAYTVSKSGTTLATVTVTSGASGYLAANASVDKGSGQPGLTAQFAGAAVCGNCSGISYAWDFGDGETSTAQNPSHTFELGGDYFVLLTVTDNAGNTAEDMLTVHVAMPPPPTVSSISPTSGPSNSTTEITVTGANFQNDAWVYIGSTPARDVIVNSGSELVAIVPPGLAAGVYDIVVENPDAQTATLPSAFTVSGAVYSAADFIPLTSGNTWTYLEADINSENTVQQPQQGSIFTDSILGTETVNGVTCTKYGESESEYDCLTVDSTSGLLVHKSVDYDSMTSTTNVRTFNPPVTYIPPSFAIGDSFTYNSTRSESTNGATPVSTSLAITITIDAVEDVLTPAGIFANAVKLTWTNVSGTETDSETVWLAPGVGIVKSIEAGNTDYCPPDGCLKVLDSACVDGVHYPAPLAAGTLDGSYWMLSLEAEKMGTWAKSGYMDVTISGNNLTAVDTYSMLSGSSPQTQTNNLTLSYYDNGTFLINQNPYYYGVFNNSGIGGMVSFSPNEAALMIFTPKCTTCTASSIAGTYYSVTLGIESNLNFYNSFVETTINANGAYTYTGYESSQSGSVMVPVSGSGTYSLTGNGTFIMDSDSGQYMGMIGADGDVLLYAKYGTGGREINYMIRKGSGLSLSNAAGPFYGLFFEKNLTPLNFKSRLSYMDLASNGFMQHLHRPGFSYAEAETETITIDSGGRIATNPDTIPAVNGNATLGVVANMDTLDSPGGGFFFRIP